MINLFFLNDFLFQFILILGGVNLLFYSLSSYYVFFEEKENEDSNQDKKEEKIENK